MVLMDPDNWSSSKQSFLAAAGGWGKGEGGGFVLLYSLSDRSAPAALTKH